MIYTYVLWKRYNQSQSVGHVLIYKLQTYIMYGGVLQ